MYGLRQLEDLMRKVQEFLVLPVLVKALLGALARALTGNRRENPWRDTGGEG